MPAAWAAWVLGRRLYFRFVILSGCIHVCLACLVALRRSRPSNSEIVGPGR
jgi:hypothetical protein